MPAHRKYKHTITTIHEWVQQHEPVQVWLRKQHGNKMKRAVSFWYYCRWAHKTPEELLALKSGFDNIDAERLLDKYLLSNCYPESTKWRSVTDVRSFYRCNYRQLQAEAGRMEYYPQKPHRAPSRKKRLELYQACFNPRDRAIICMATCTALALETLTRLRWSNFEDGWMTRYIPHISVGSHLVKGHGKGRYRGVRQETFVTPECKQELLRYRDFMTKRYGVLWQDDMHVFLALERAHPPLSYYGCANLVCRISHTAHVGFGIHDGRRIVETALENVGCPRNWIQKIKGRKVRGEDAPYSKPAVEQLRGKYREALPELQFLNAGGEEPAGLSAEDRDEIMRILQAVREGKLTWKE